MAREQISMRPSNESTVQQLALARKQGDAFAAALQEMTRNEAHGRSRVAGDYLVAVAVEDAEGLYAMENGDLQWHEPSQETAHIEVVVCDAADGRFLPGLDVEVSVRRDSGEFVGTANHDFLWHPWLYHYGRNWQVDGEGDYTITVRFAAPRFMRHDKKNGRRFAEGAEVTFEGIHISPGQKRS